MYLVWLAYPHEWLCPTFMNNCPTLLPSAMTLPPSWATLSHLHEWLLSSWMTLSHLHEWLSPPPCVMTPPFINYPLQPSWMTLPPSWTTFFASEVLCLPHCKNNWQCAYHTIMINIHLFFCMKNPPDPPPPPTTQWREWKLVVDHTMSPQTPLSRRGGSSSFAHSSTRIPMAPHSRMACPQHKQLL